MYEKNEDNDLEAIELVETINDLLKKDEILHGTDKKLTVLNLSDKTSYLGSIRIYDEKKLSKFEKDLKESLSRYKNKSISSQFVVSCCQAPHTNISFKIDISK